MQTRHIPLGKAREYRAILNRRNRVRTARYIIAADLASGATCLNTRIAVTMPTTHWAIFDWELSRYQPTI